MLGMEGGAREIMSAQDQRQPGGSRSGGQTADGDGEGQKRDCRGGAGETQKGSEGEGAKSRKEKQEARTLRATWPSAGTNKAA